MPEQKLSHSLAQLVSRIQERLLARGVRERQACIASGAGADFVRDMRRRGHSPTVERLWRLAVYLETPLWHFIEPLAPAVGCEGAALAAEENRLQLQRDIGDRIFWARSLVYRDAAELAGLMGISTACLSLIESGERMPSADEIVQLANRLRVTTDYLLRGILVSHMDEELSLRLAALHPELVLKRERMDSDKGKARECGTRPVTMWSVPVG